ncbi:ATPase [Desulfobacula sp.]|uniref:ATPase n=1 Tax=Desulfobacula sp. TaxID=2593537 RepID=UPI00260E05BC|nr:ATPase [Desulfobacula sp.]
MSSLMGEKLIQKQKISHDQLQKALDYQRLHGGRIGNSIVTLGFLTEDEVAEFFRAVPEIPDSLAKLDLTYSFIESLVVKHALNLRVFNFTDMCNSTKLPMFIVTEAIDILRQNYFLQVKSAGQFSKLSYTFNLTEAGIKKAKELLSVSRYTGPAPVSLRAYRNQVEAQTVKSVYVDEKNIKKAFSEIVISDDMVQKFGPAISSGKSIFLYGPPGNGKTTIAEIIGEVLPGTIRVPYAVQVEGEIITVFDRASHVRVDSDEPDDSTDQRWVKIKRPVIMTGGEMTLKGLDLDFNHIAKFYEAPLQMKANNGLFIVDDFGRQQVDSQTLLNRWIVPLERRTDFLTLHTGMKIEIPFDQLVIFSTNLEPKKLVDEAFLRRIRYKIKVGYPSLDEYKQIFQKVCESNGMIFDENVFKFLIDLYKEKRVNMCSCHCRDILDWMVNNAHYRDEKPKLTKETILASWESYFVEM